MTTGNVHNHDCNGNDPKCAACVEYGGVTEPKGEAMSTVRDDVYGAIDGERDYQRKWGGSRHETGAFLTFMREYLRRAELLNTPMRAAG